MYSEKGLIFFPTRELEGTPAHYQLRYEDIYFPATDKTKLHGWYVPAANPEKTITLLWFHGNAGNISHRLENLALLHRSLEVSIFIFDYREFGLSSGHISKAGTYLDALGAWHYLVQEREIAPGDILLFGRSLGTALAVDLSVSEPCLGVVLEAAFTSSQDMLSRYFFGAIPPELLHSAYENLAKIHLVRAPLLFVHGQYDEAIPLEMSRRLYQAAKSPKRFYMVPGAGHNDTYLVGGADYFRQWQVFLQECLEKES
ncbi:MAG: alpha/beta hydrolase [Deltaproteobacteria bacterium]|nr:MAG: alpha/beta hydrolase [Deltaproteobacteria bacterium]